MKITKVEGRNKSHKVFLYAISTCVWCKRTKKLLIDFDVEYEYVDVDHVNQEEREHIRKEILDRGGRLSYPVTIIDDKILINGLHEDKIREALEI